MNREPFLRRIADGKLLLRYSSMTANVTCDCCDAEEKIVYSPDFPDNLKHTSWCIVTAARRFFPDFAPSPYPEKLRRWGSTYTQNDAPAFDWFGEQEG